MSGIENKQGATMPRQGRLHLPGGCYHVMGRGLERRFIFKESRDKQMFLQRLAGGLERTGAECLAWALMGNHYHLLIRVSSVPLPKLMASLLGGFAADYNKSHNRVGYVFQNRYKSILCDADAYLLELVRYIHLNPYRAKWVKSLDALASFPWTGHSALMGKSVQAWQNISFVLSQFSSRVAIARKRYFEFLADGMRSDATPGLLGGGLIRSYSGWENAQSFRQEHASRIGDERILGESRFVEYAIQADELKFEEKARLRQQGWTLDRLIECVCRKYQIEQNDLIRKGRDNAVSNAKWLVCFWGTRQLGETVSTVGRRLGISQPGASYACKKGEAYCKENGLEFCWIKH